MNVKTRYIRFRIPKNNVFQILNSCRKNKICIHIDLRSIATGFFNKQVLFEEINYYLENKKPSDFLIDEFKKYLNDLYRTFKAFNPFFVIFYDYGKNIQNTAISNSYKSGGSSLRDVLHDSEQRNLYYQLQNRYFIEIESQFIRKNISKIFFLKDYESDFIPHYCIKNDLHECGKQTTLNLILSNDKDLLQTCQFKNTIQCTNKYVKVKNQNRKELKIELWDDYNALSYIYPSFKPGVLKSRHLSLILAIAGDKADGIDGVKDIGNKKAMDLVQKFQLEPDITEIQNNKENLPDVIKNNLKMIIENFKMINFDEQIKRTKILNNI